jgi:hypothetical protein
MLVAIDVRVRGFRGWRGRVWLAGLLLKLAGRVLGCQVTMALQEMRNA